MNRLIKSLLFVSAVLTAIISYSQNITNKGKEFWVGYGHHQFMEQGSNDQDMVIYLSAEDQPATVTVTIDSSGIIPSLWWSRTYNIPPYTVISIENNLTPATSWTPVSAAGPGRSYGPIPKGPIDAGPAQTNANFDARLYTDPPPAGTGGAGLFRKKGIHIQSNVPIVAYAHIYGSASSGATMLLPVEAWGQSYVSVNSEQSYGSDCYSWMYVIAQKDNTVVEIIPSTLTRAQDRTGLRPGVAKQITLMKGQIYQIIGANQNADANGNGGTSSDGRNLTGTKVRSIAGVGGECFPIAVFSGSSRTANPTGCGSGGGDNDNQQLFPTHAWGKRYVTAPFSNSASASSFATCSYKIVVKDPATQVKKNGVVMSGMNPAGYYYYESSTADYIEADKPIQVAQFMTGGSCIANGDGDPEMIILSPLEQATKRVGFYRNIKENINTNYLTLVIPTQGISSLRIDNSPTYTYSYAHPNLPGYSIVIKRWNPSAQAQCIVYSDSAFNAITYGEGSVESYGYNAGTNVNNLNAIGSVHNQLDPTVAEHPFTCTNTPVELSVLMAYQPTQLVWELSALSGVLSPSTDVAQSPPTLAGTVTVDGIPYYKYTLPGTYMFSQADTFQVTIHATSPTVENCNNTEDIKINYIVKDKPKPDFTFTHSGCTLDTVYFAGQNLAGGGFTLGQWNWTFPGPATATGQNVKTLLQPGTHQIKLNAVSNEGCVGDTMKEIVVYPRPTATFGTTPSTVCLGQTITLSDTSSYAGTSPVINNWYWDLGDGQVFNNANGNNVVANYTAPNTYTVRHAVKVTDLCVSDTISKVVVISPEALISFTYPTNCLPTSGLAQFTASATDLGGIPVTNYTWDFGDPGSAPNNSSTSQNPSHTYTSFGTYPVTLTITNNTGCTGDTTVNLTFSTLPALAYAPVAAICQNASPVSIANGSVTNSVTGTGEYHGPATTLAGMFDPAAAGPGTHKIWYVFTASGGCKDSVSVDVTVNARPAKPAVNSPVSYCQNATASALTATALPGFTLTWYNNSALTGGSAAAPVPLTNATGTFTYYVTQTDPATGCTSEAEMIMVNILAGISGNTIGADQTICGGTSPATLTGTGALSGGTGTYTYQWQQSTDGGATWSDIASATAATLNPAAVTGTIRYQRVVSDGLCSVTSNVVIITVQGTMGSFDISGNQTICEGSQPALIDGQTPTGGSGTFTYEWESSADGASWTTITGETAEDYQPPVLTSGMYYRRKVTSGACSATSSIAHVTVNIKPNGTISAPAAICSYDAGPVSFMASAGTAPFTLQWTIAGPSGTNTLAQTVVNNGPSSITAIPIGSTAGTYTITLTGITDNNGCANTAAANVVNTTVTAQPVLTTSPTVSICAGSSTVLTVSGADTYVWSPATGLSSTTGSSVTASPSAATSYTVTGTTNGCTNISNIGVNVNPVPPMIGGGTSYSFCQYNVVTAPLDVQVGAGYTLMWYDNPGLTNGSPIAPVPSTAIPGFFQFYVTQVSAAGCEGAPKIVYVDVYPMLAGNILSGDQTICEGSPIAPFTAPVPTGGMPVPLVYQWQESTDGGTTWTDISGATAVNYTPAPPTVTTKYRRKVKAAGCMDTSNEITITVLTAITNNTIAADQTVCEGSTPALLDGQTPAGTGTLTIQWESSADGTNWTAIAGATNEDYQPAILAATTYFRRKVTNSVCSVNSAPVIITVNPQPQGAITGPAAICAYDAADVVFTASAGTAPFTVQITVNGPSGSNTITQSIANSPATINVIPANSAAGNYTITLSSVTDSKGCVRNTGMSTFNIMVNAQPVLTISPAVSICEGTNTTLTVSGASSYSWSPAAGLSSATGSSVTASPASNTNYTVTGTANGCTNTATVAVNVNPKPVASFTVNSSICSGDNATITSSSTIPAGSIVTWNWDLGNGTTPSYTNGNAFNVSYTGNSNYTIKLVTISDKGCTSATASQNIAVHPLPVVDFNPPAGICMPGGSASFTNTTTVADNSDLTYLWNFGDLSTSADANPTHVYATANNYTVRLTATSSFGCANQVDKSLSDFYEKPVAYFTVTPDEICQGADISFNEQSTAPNSTIQSWKWNFDDNSSSVSEIPSKRFSTPGVYDVQLEVTNAVGCKSDPYTHQVTVHLQPVIDAGQSFVVSQGSTVKFTATANSPGLTFSWTPPFGLSDAASLNPTLVANSDQTYTLKAIGEFGCTATDVLTVKILKPVEIPNVITPNGDNIHDKWMIPNLADYPNCTVEIFNRYGQQVFYSVGYNKPWDGTMKGKDLPVGTYYYVIELKNGFKAITGSVTIVR